MKESIQAYIQHENSRMYFNIFYSLGYLIVILSAINNIANLSIVIPVSMFHALTNVLYLSNSPGIQASNNEILSAGQNGPRWFKKRIELLTKE
jgi:1,4-dihydroxy-2-naphthoate octaprenyltransferase